jgi:addiction module HigA family antidote
MSLQPHNPSHPGELIYRTYIEPFDSITVAGIARELGVNKSTFSRLVAGKVAITSDMAVKLSAVLGRSAESWLRLQEQYDLWQSRQAIHVKAYSRIDFSKAS